MPADGGGTGTFNPNAVFQRAARLLLVALLVIGSAVAWRWRSVLDPVALTNAIGSDSLTPVGFLVVHILASLLFVPRTPFAILAGMLFGIGWGIVWAELGSVAGACAGFLVARYIKGGWFEAKRGSRIEPLLQQVERGGWRSVALLRLIPAIPHSAANYGLALTRLSLRDYAFGSLVGQLPMTITYVALGAAGERWLSGGSGWAEPIMVGLGALSISLLIAGYFRQGSMSNLQGFWHRTAGRPVEEFDGVDNGHATAGDEVGHATDIPGRH
jgi:uncharacterized membrane protein YdjX (TVP38/TMEM64 family)